MKISMYMYVDAGAKLEWDTDDMSEEEVALIKKGLIPLRFRDMLENGDNVGYYENVSYSVMEGED